MTIGQTTSTRLREFLAGMQATIPLEIGAVPFGIIFGATALTNGLSPGGALGMSAFVFAGSAQFIGSNLIGQGVAAPVIILTTFIVNLRHALYGATLAPYLKHLPQTWLAPLAFLMTDETFVIAYKHFEDSAEQSPHLHWYYLGSAVFMYVNWQLWTLVGVLVGSRIENPNALGLDFALVVTFIGMLMPMIRSRAILIAVVIASMVALAGNALPNKLGLLAAALVGVVIGMILPAPAERQSERQP